MEQENPNPEQSTPISNPESMIEEPRELKHHWFQQNIPLVLIIKNVLNYQDPKKEVQEFVFKYQTAFNHAVYGLRDPEDISEEIKNAGITFSTPCGKPIENHQYFYRCLDCDKFRNMESSFVTVICKECFEKSDHTGHRVFMSQKNNESTGICDCGDPECIEEAGFCSDHKYVKINPEEILQKFPADLKHSLLEKAHESFYLRFSLLEESFMANSQDEVKRLRIVSLAAGSPVACLRELLNVNKAYIILISHLFRSPLPPGKNLLYHRCSNLEHTILEDEPHECKCTLLELCIRFISLSPMVTQRQLTDLFTELLRDDLFKHHIVETFCKYLSFLIPSYHGTESKKAVPPVYSPFMMTAQLFGTENLCLIPIKNGTIHNLYKGLKKIIDQCTYPGEIITEQFDEIGSLLCYCFLSSHKAAGFELIHKAQHFKQAFEILMNYNIKFAYSKRIGIGTLPPDINYTLLNDIFIVSRSIEFLIEKGYKVIEYEQNEGKKAVMQIILKEWYEYFNICKGIIKIEKSESPDTLFYPTFERMLTLMLTSFVKPLSQEYLQRFLSECLNLANQEGLTAFGQTFGENVLNNFGAFRYLQLIHNYQSGPLHLVYLYINNLMHEHDIIALQMTSLLLDKIDVFEYYTTNFFTYSPEISNFLLRGEELAEDERYKDKLIVIEDYLAMLNHLMNDELCYLSSQTGKKNENIVQDPAFNDRYYKIMKRLLINLMASLYWTTLKDIKMRLRNLIKEDKFTEEIVSEISHLDPETLKIRLKDQYLKDFDPYFFFKTRSAQKNIVYAFANRNKDAKVDVISGQFYNDLPSYLYDIQIKFFSSSLLFALKHIIVNWKEAYINVVGAVLRLIFLNIKLINFLEDERKHTLTQHFLTVFANSEFIEKLKHLSSLEGLQDYTACIQKILKHLRPLGGEFLNLLPESLEEETDSPKLDKKALAQQRMLKLKEEFSLKQKAFADKNLNEIGDASAQEKSKQIFEEEEEKDAKNEMCQFCMEPLNNGKTYGVPVFVNFTNNFGYDDYQLLRQIRDKQAFTHEEYLTIKTCGHHFHEECHKKIYDEIWELKNMQRNQSIYWNFFEINCPVCKVLTNNFLVIYQEKKPIKMEEEESKSLEKDIKEKMKPEENKENTEQPDRGDGNEDEDSFESADSSQSGGSEENANEAVTEESETAKLMKAPITFDFIERILKLKYYCKSRDPFTTKRPVAKEELENLTNTLQNAFSYFVESTHLFTNRKNISENFFVFYHLLSNYFQFYRKLLISTGKEHIFPKYELSSLSLDCYEFFRSFKQNRDFEYTIMSLDTEITITCWKLLSCIYDNSAEVIESIKKFLVNTIIARALMLGVLTHTKNINQVFKEILSDDLLKQKFFESIHQPVISLIYTYLLLPSKDSSKDGYREAHNKLQLFFKNYIEEEEFFDGLFHIFEDKRLSIRNILQIDHSIQPLIDYQEIISLYHSEDQLTEEKPNNIEETAISELSVKRKRPFFTYLPPTYAQFNQTYLKSHCILCNEHKMQNNICLCLICGYVICRRSCTGGNPKFGNLTVHSLKYHSCLGIYVDIKELSVYFICFPEISVYPCNLYIDKFGTNIQDLLTESRNKLYSLDFKAINLNKKEMDALKKISDLGYEIPQKINEIVLKFQKKMQPGYY